MADRYIISEMSGMMNQLNSFRWGKSCSILILIATSIPLCVSETLCQTASRNALIEYRNGRDTKVQVPLLNMAMEKCCDEMCEEDTYEWIILNVAGIHSRFAYSALSVLEVEHAEYHKHLDNPPPLSLEQEQLDIVNKYANDAQHFYEVGLLCHGSNSIMMNEKWDSFKREVVDRVKTIDVEVKRLRGEKKRNSELKDDHHLSVPHQLEEAATCPIEVLDMNSTHHT
jgi:hypothetical protein